MFIPAGSSERRKSLQEASLREVGALKKGLAVSKYARYTREDVYGDFLTAANGHFRGLGLLTWEGLILS